MLRAPVGLAARGRRFWRVTTEQFELSDAELELLAEACRTLDTIDVLQRAVVELGPTVLGSAGQLVLNPAVAELRQQRIALHRLVASLRLPDEGGGSVPSAVSLGRQEAAQQRWRGHVKGL